LAGNLRKHRAAISFICRDLPGNLSAVVEAEGFIVHRLNHFPTVHAREIPAEHVVRKDDYGQWLGVHWLIDAEQTIDVLTRQSEPVSWIVLDHYSLDTEWERRIRPHARSIMVIDDLANRAHDCDVLLDQNLSLETTERYDRLVPQHCRKFIGPQYALLRPE